MHFNKIISTIMNFLASNMKYTIDLGELGAFNVDKKEIRLKPYFKYNHRIDRMDVSDKCEMSMDKKILQYLL